MTNQALAALSSTHSSQQDQLLEMLREEVYRALRFQKDGWQRRIVTPLLNWPLMRCVRLALDFDRQAAAASGGFGAASGWLLPRFVETVQVEIERAIPPARGPLVVAANHPGSLDVFLISSFLNRKDLKVIARDMPFLRSLPNVDACMVYSTRDMSQRANVLRQGLRHLESGGALLVCASGNLDPDPARLPGAIESLDTWNNSVALFLKRVPDLCAVVAITSRMIDARWLEHPVLRLRKSRWDRQFLGELLQTSAQILFPGKYHISPKITFSRPLSSVDFAGRPPVEKIHQELVHLAKQQMLLHMKG